MINYQTISLTESNLVELQSSIIKGFKSDLRASIGYFPTGYDVSVNKRGITFVGGDTQRADYHLHWNDNFIKHKTESKQVSLNESELNSKYIIIAYILQNKELFKKVAERWCANQTVFSNRVSNGMDIKSINYDDR